MRFVSRRRRAGVSSIVGSIFFVLIMVVAIASLVTIFNSFTAYNSQVNQASNSNLQAQDTQLSVTNSQFGAFPPSTTSNFNVATSCTVGSTFPTNRPKAFTAAGMWWDFFSCNSNYQYSTSFDGVTWETPTTIPAIVVGYTVGSDFDVEAENTVLYYAIAKVGASDFQLGIGTLAAGGTNAAPAGTITWTSSPAQVVTTANAIGPIQISIDAVGNLWVEVHQGATAIAIYERQACASGASANNGWEPNSCSSGANPTNYAPVALGALSANAHSIFSEAPDALASTGVIMLYETGSAVSPSTGTLAVITQTALASTAWNTITLSGISDYSLTSSSGIFIGNTLYVAGLANAAVGQTTGTLKFWALPFTSITTATNTAEQTIESSTAAWQAALTSTGGTLVLFDNPTATSIQYYSSASLGSIWSAAISFVSGETAINGLCPSDNSFAVTWTGASPFNVRFAALSTFTVSNASPFAVHLVDLYIYNPATNSLVAHYYYNSTEEFDYYVGQGSSMVIPIRFIWAATTSYLVTVGTDAGVTTQLTVSSPPVPTTTCPAGSFLSQIAPTQTCASVPAAASPLVTYLSSATTCNVASATTSAGLTTPITYTTSSLSSGKLYLGMTFNVASPATTAITSKWQFAYGTGSSPACAATSGLGSTIGQVYTITTQAGAAGSWGQSIGVALKGLAANTAYWFDVQVTDSSGATWVYSNQAASITDVLSATSSLPNVVETDNANSCTHTNTATTLMGGLGVTYTTLSSAIGSGNAKVTLSFNLQSPATLGDTNKWQIAYGSTATPACNAVATGNLVGKQYTVESEAAAVMSLEQSGSVVISGLLPSTTYWFDVESADASVNQWITSSPTLAVSEETNTAAGNIPANIVYPLSAQTAACVTTAAATSMAGLKELYTLTSSSTGKIYGSLTVNVLASGTLTTVGVTSAWKLSYGDVNSIAVPACAGAAVGTIVGQSYTTKTVTTTAFSEAQTEQFVISGLTPGHTYWFDLQVTNTGTGFTETYSVPTLSITDIQPANTVHDNLIQLTGNAPSCTIGTAASARMGGMAVIPTTANPPMEYQTTSYGTGNVVITFAMQASTVATAGSTYKWQLSYGAVTDPQSGASATANPACSVAATGTTVGNGYTFTQQSGANPGSLEEMVTVEISLGHGAMYWFDLQSTDSVTGAVNTLPQITISEAA